jgi:peptide deformylase
MAVLPVIVAPDPRLKVKCTPIDSVDEPIRKLMHDMLDSMHDHNGIGLAAPQVGVNKRVIVMDIAPKDGPGNPIKLGNPEIIWHSDEEILSEEGCLSLPTYYADVNRPERVKVKYLDYGNQPQEIDAEGLFAVCIQHEIDHLDGILFVDHISLLKRKMILRKLQKFKKQNA